MLIFTYFEGVAEIDIAGEFRLITRWLWDWNGIGHAAHVLNEYHARKHPLFDAMKAKARELPTVNPAGYEESCYMRWLALGMVESRSPVLMLDYDVFPNPRKLLMMPKCGHGLVVLGKSRCPCAVAGKPSAFTAQAERFLGYVPDERDREGGRPHVSDQEILAKRDAPPGVSFVDAVPQFTEAGWEEGLAVHFSTHVARTMNMYPKWQHVHNIGAPCIQERTTK